MSTQRTPVSNPELSSSPRPSGSLPVSPGLEDCGDRVSFMGVEVLKGVGGPRTPNVERFSKEVLTSWDLKLMQKLAVGLELNQAVLLDGGGPRVVRDRCLDFLRAPRRMRLRPVAQQRPHRQLLHGLLPRRLG
jgi:hypothetical protein